MPAIAWIQTKPELTNISNWLTERLAVIHEAYEHFTAGDTNYLPDPRFTLSVDEQVEYQHQFKIVGDTRLAEFVVIAHLKLRLIRHNSTAAITYQIVIPEQLKSMLVLDASYPIRQLEKIDPTLHNAEYLPS